MLVVHIWEVENGVKAFSGGSMDHVNHVRQLLGIYFVVLLHQIASDSIPLIMQNLAPAGNFGVSEVSRDNSNKSTALGGVEGDMVL